MPGDRPAHAQRMMIALLALGASGACKQRESLGTNCLTPRQACAAKSCGDVCSACSEGSLSTPDIDGTCGADGVCSTAAPSCGPIDGGASAGCGKTGATTGQLTGQTITVAGQTRTYAISIPSDYTGTTPLALVLVWHGVNIDGSTARALFNLEAKSNGAAIFVYPDESAASGWDVSPGSADIQLFKDLVSSMSSNYCIDPNRIFSTGHSTGAVMTNSLGCNYGDLLRAIAPASGTSPGTGARSTCTGKVAVLIAHGENDPLIPFAQGQATRDFWIAQNGCTTQTTTWASEPACLAYQGCQTDLPVVLCVHDGGHAWPSLSYGCDADAGICIDGGAAIWSFFSSFH
jgi:poly(3-hydroxybutyrate) depolymerase